MQPEKLETPCKVKDCPALAKRTSIYSYCPIHESVATDQAMFDKALGGKLNAKLKEFALDCDRGVYPKRSW